MATRTAVAREPLLIVLAASAGAVDAISFLTFHVFTANMTGNVVLLGVALSAESSAEVLRAAVALAGFLVGVLVAARAVARPAAGSAWSPRIVAVLGVTLILQVAFAIWWIAVDGFPSGTARDVLAGMSAVAMGAQSGAVAAMALPNVATTYITGTLTGLLGSIATGGRSKVDLLRAGVIAGLAVGATAGALLVTHARECAPLLPALLTASVIAAVTLSRR